MLLNVIGKLSSVVDRQSVFIDKLSTTIDRLDKTTAALKETLTNVFNRQVSETQRLEASLKKSSW